MAILLHIETATELTSVCISKDTDVLSIKNGSGPMMHSQELTVLIQDSMKELDLSFKELDAVAVSQGPGSYTALRVGTSVAKGICYASDKPMIAIDTLEALAYTTALHMEADFYCPMIDARRKEVYMSFYNNKNTILKPCQALILDVSSFGEYVEKGQTIAFSGNGSPKFKEMISRPEFLFSGINCSAINLIPLALEAYEKKEFKSIAYFEPVYLKPPNITIPKKRL